MLTILIFLWCTGWAIAAVKRLANGNFRAIFPTLLITYAFCVLPIAIDAVFQRPDMHVFPGLQVANEETDVRAVYNIFMALVMPTLWYVGGARSRPSSEPPRKLSFELHPAVKFLCIVGAILPFILVVASPHPAAYLDYALPQRASFVGAVVAFHAYIAMAVRVSQLCICVLLLSVRKLTAGAWVAAVIPLLGTIWLSGKRSSFAMALLLVLLILWQRSALRKPATVLMITGVAIVTLGLFSVEYQQTYRQGSSVGTEYTGFRVDYARDSQIRMAMYANMNPDRMRITSETGQTLVLYAGTPVPRQLWPSKPLPYSQYFTSAMFRSPPREWGWGMTTSVYAEWISNLGYLGYAAGPIFLGIAARVADRGKQPLTRLIGCVCVMLLVVQHVTAFYILIAAWVAMLCVERMTPATRRLSAHKPANSMNQNLEL